MQPPAATQPPSSFVDDLPLMSALCRAVRSDADRVELLEFLDGAAALEPTALRRLATAGMVSFNLELLTERDVSGYLAIARLAHRERGVPVLRELLRGALALATLAPFGCEPAPFDADGAAARVRRFAAFVRAWPIPRNAWKFCGLRASTDAALFRACLRDDGRGEALSDFLDGVAPPTTQIGAAPFGLM